MVQGTPGDHVELPRLHDAASRASQRGQSNYLRLLRLQLALPLAAATAAVIASGREGAVVVSLLFLFGLAASVAMQLWRPERLWFDGRVVAESIKTIAWRYAMGVPPFGVDVGEVAARALVETRSREVLKERVDAAERIASEAAGPLVTERMTEVRRLGWASRRSVYVRDRLDDQLRWYTRRSRDNGRLAKRWLFLVSGLQLGGLVLAVLRAAGMLDVNVFGILSAAIGSAVAWLQVKRHQDLARSYGLAAFELGILKDKMQQVDAPEVFADLVHEAEEAMSREHVAWAAKRS